MAAGRTYTPIATTKLTTDTSVVTFSSIPQTYTDIIVIFNGMITGDAWFLTLRFNGDTGTNYSTTLIEGSGSTAVSERLTNYAPGIVNSYSYANMSYDEGGIIKFNIMNYSNSNTYKSVLLTGGNANSAARAPGVAAAVGLWRNTNAITSISIQSYLSSGINIKSGATITLYGIVAA